MEITKEEQTFPLRVKIVKPVSLWVQPGMSFSKADFFYSGQNKLSTSWVNRNPLMDILKRGLSTANILHFDNAI